MNREIWVKKHTRQTPSGKTTSVKKHKRLVTGYPQILGMSQLSPDERAKERQIQAILKELREPGIYEYESHRAGAGAVKVVDNDYQNLMSASRTKRVVRQIRMRRGGTVGVYPVADMKKGGFYVNIFVR